MCFFSMRQGSSVCGSVWAKDSEDEEDDGYDDDDDDEDLCCDEEVAVVDASEITSAGISTSVLPQKRNVVSVEAL